MHSEKVIQQLMDALHENARYWERQSGTVLERIDGATFSILNILDGMSGSFDYSIDDIAEHSHDLMLHEFYYENEKK